MAEVTIHTAGHCTTFAALARRDSPWQRVPFPACFGLIEPKEGAPFLFDTGYARHVFPAARRFPLALYRWALDVKPGPDAVELLAGRGIMPEAVAAIIISHFHPDHIGGLRDFPAARFICSRRAWEAMRGRVGFSALRHGFLAELVPPDFEERATFAEDLPPASTVDGGRRLELGGEAFTLVPLEGHAAGQLGLLVRRDDGRPVLFAADAIWRRSSLEDAIGPHPLAMRVHHDSRLYAETLARLAAMRRADPSLEIVPSHDPGPA